MAPVAADIGQFINIGEADHTTVIYGAANKKSQILAKECGYCGHCYLAKECGYCGHCYLANELVCKGPTYRYHDLLERENKTTLAPEGSGLFRHAT